MAARKAPTTIKKYANRRLYHTGTSTYVTLEDLSVMVRGGEDFVVYDAKTGDDITRSVLTQIIFEQESKEGQNLLPITFLRQLIRFYGDSLQVLVPSYLEFSMDNLSREQQSLARSDGPDLRHQGVPRHGGAGARQHGLLHGRHADVHPLRGPRRACPGAGLPRWAPPSAPPPEKADGELDELKAQMAAMQEKLEALAKK